MEISYPVTVPNRCLRCPHQQNDFLPWQKGGEIVSSQHATTLKALSKAASEQVCLCEFMQHFKIFPSIILLNLEGSPAHLCEKK